MNENRHTFNPGIIPRAASKQAPEIRPCSRNSGLGASPNLPSGSDPITLKYLTNRNNVKFSKVKTSKGHHSLKLEQTFKSTQHLCSL